MRVTGTLARQARKLRISAARGPPLSFPCFMQIPSMRFVSVHVQVGLGDRLFQLLFGLAQAWRCNAVFRILSVSQNHHSKVDYFDDVNILAYFRQFIGQGGRIDKVVQEAPDAVWKRIKYASPFIGKEEGVLYVNYFQSHYHFEDMFSHQQVCKMLGVANGRKRVDLLYPSAPKKGLFVHVRLGNYRSSAHFVHDLDLGAYYERALRTARERLPQGVILHVVSDNIEHCKNNTTLRAFDEIVFVEGLNEVDTLYLMTTCRYGRICANSTFSWFGAYLNKDVDKFVALPARWWKLDSCLEGFYFNGASKFDV
jgi:hypothetical protein